MATSGHNSPLGISFSLDDLPLPMLHNLLLYLLLPLSFNFLDFLLIRVVDLKPGLDTGKITLHVNCFLILPFGMYLGLDVVKVESSFLFLDLKKCIQYGLLFDEQLVDGVLKVLNFTLQFPALDEFLQHVIVADLQSN